MDGCSSLVAAAGVLGLLLNASTPSHTRVGAPLHFLHRCTITLFCSIGALHLLMHFYYGGQVGLFTEIDSSVLAGLHLMPCPRRRIACMDLAWDYPGVLPYYYHYRYYY